MMDRYSVSYREELTSNMRDVNLWTVFDQLDLKLNEEIHLMWVLEEFIHEKHIQNDPWMCRAGSNGVYWKNRENETIVYRYPHLEKVRERLSEYKKSILSHGSYIKQNEMLKSVIPNPVVMEKVIRKSQSVLWEYMRTENKSSLVEEMGVLLEEVNSGNHFTISIEDLYSLLFMSKFDVSKYLSLVKMANHDQQMYAYTFSQDYELSLRIREYKKRARKREILGHSALKDWVDDDLESDSGKLLRKEESSGKFEFSSVFVDQEIQKNDEVVHSKALKILDAAQEELMRFEEVLMEGEDRLKRELEKPDEPYIRRLMTEVKGLCANFEAQTAAAEEMATFENLNNSNGSIVLVDESSRKRISIKPRTRL